MGKGHIVSGADPVCVSVTPVLTSADSTVYLKISQIGKISQDISFF